MGTTILSHCKSHVLRVAHFYLRNAQTCLVLALRDLKRQRKLNGVKLLFSCEAVSLSLSLSLSVCLCPSCRCVYDIVSYALRSSLDCRRSEETQTHTQQLRLATHSHNTLEGCFEAVVVAIWTRVNSAALPPAARALLRLSKSSSQCATLRRCGRGSSSSSRQWPVQPHPGCRRVVVAFESCL